MRETKDQTITRLEQKVSKLEDELKTLKKNIRTSRKDSRLKSFEKEKTYLKEISQLQIEMSKMRKTWEREKEEWEKKIKEEIYWKEYWRGLVKNEEDDIREKQLTREQDEWLDVCRRDDDKRLEYFNMGMYCDPYHLDFIKGNNLILLINPHTGEKLSTYGQEKIYDLIRENPYYLQKLKEIEPYLKMLENDNSQDYFDSKQSIHDIGMDVYKTLYPDFPFEVYSI